MEANVILDTIRELYLGVQLPDFCCLLVLFFNKKSLF